MFNHSLRLNFSRLSVLLAASAALAQSPPAGPNVVLIIADDLGYAETGCYGQKKIRTPHIDRLAAEGLRFTQFYSGSPVCAPTRCTLMTGQHTGHAEIRANREIQPEGQHPISAGAITLAEALQARGYATAGIGKWGLGPPGSHGAPEKQGFDLFFGYNCQRAAHNYYPTYLWENDRKIPLNNPEFPSRQEFPADADPNDPAAYQRYRGNEYAPDLMVARGLEFIRANRERPFFLYVALPIPHMALQVPEDSLKEYAGAFPETPYLGGKGYLPHRTPRAAYAAMVSRLDRYVGQIVGLLQELQLEERTLVLFTSDNGPTHNGGTDSAFFNSTGPLRGLKGSVYEGGVRVPLIARWPGRITAGKVTEHVAAMWDMLPTLCEITGAETPPGIDGISFAPTLLGKGGQKEHEYLYWEYPGGGGQQAVRVGNFKAVRQNLLRGQKRTELYNLENDVGEQHDIAADHPEVVKRMERIMREARRPSAVFEFAPLDKEAS
ncbi:MAG TPA: arylsulfatase [Phycisphaerae bacterium]|nr:arylsulfatase [Phycisphaerae bacterium]HOJ55115.1 arylsulfatase [Phycisphaerae bacterium]HOL27919.1 arylsulfatase [Phycisphaerae bacterium]HPP21738.1 arylsulfatase [Phycisphaerae bacterium]HPU31549.1 arylsulfatase [Phycisphaerae bacterium]